MPAGNIEVRRIAFTSAKTFADVLARLEAKIGKPDMRKLTKDIAEAESEEELQAIVHKAVLAEAAH